ncbi:hypothetical protein TSUD_368800 [Trifolium subterraneum]|uniref:Reverse transcriptase zinc-binding domain-containing protein n=1 Tax=Trifolium subterraneum TaxID=3900 RepID=A0A2Z6NHS3_TRISU|nr:hypothetical protein TSUD_368800 [Trifolium subterraneum]
MAKVVKGREGGLRRVLSSGLGMGRLPFSGLARGWEDKMRELGWDDGGAAWLWRRQLWVWEEEMLAECMSLFSDIVLPPNDTDKWVWRHDPGGGYTVRGAYTLLTCPDIAVVDVLTDLIWHKQVPIKVFILPWWLIRNRLPTKDNLVRRHIITPDSQLCVTGCGEVETAQHLFLCCSIFAPLWSLFRAWVWVYPRLIRFQFRTTLFNSLIPPEACALAACSCSSFSYVVFGWCGTSGTIEYSRLKLIQFTTC